MNMLNNILKFFILLLCMTISYTAFSQKSSEEYFNTASSLYIHEKAKEAMYMAQRGLELYEGNEKLQELYDLIAEQEQQKQQQKQQQQQQKKEENKQGDDSSESNSGSGSSDDSPQNSEQKSDEKQEQGKSGDSQDENDDSQKMRDKSDPNKDSQQDDSADGASENDDEEEKQSAGEQESEEDKTEDDEPRESGFSQMNDSKGSQEQKGQISTMEAEMLLQSIENQDRNVQMKVQRHKNKQSQQRKVEKDW